MGMSLHFVGVLFPEITNKQTDDEIPFSHHEIKKKDFLLTDITFPHLTLLSFDTLAIIYINIHQCNIIYDIKDVVEK